MVIETYDKTFCIDNQNLETAVSLWLVAKRPKEVNPSRQGFQKYRILYQAFDGRNETCAAQQNECHHLQVLNTEYSNSPQCYTQGKLEKSKYQDKTWSRTALKGILD